MFHVVDLLIVFVCCCIIICLVQLFPSHKFSVFLSCVAVLASSPFLFNCAGHHSSMSLPLFSS